jgi:hypothetical protein
VENTVRVFLCSAYRDMQAERNYLHAEVFPRVQQRYQEAGYNLEIVDPRYQAGSEEEAEGLAQLDATLDWVEACMPHFLCLLGSNYGKVILEVPDAVGRKHPAVRHFFRISRIHLETMTAVLRDPARAYHSYFYVRKPEFMEYVPVYEKSTYVPNNKLEALNEIEGHKLEIFKEALQRTGRPVRSYACSYDAIARQVAELEDLGAKVEHDLLTMIGLVEPAPAEAVEETVPGTMVTEDAAGMVEAAGLATTVPMALESTAPSPARPDVSLLHMSQLAEGDIEAASLEMPTPLAPTSAFNDDAMIDQIVAEAQGEAGQPGVSGEETVITEHAVIDEASAEQAADEIFADGTAEAGAPVSEDAVAEELLSDEAVNPEAAEAAANEIFAVGDEAPPPVNPNDPSFEVAPEVMREEVSAFDFSDAVSSEPMEEVVVEEEPPKKKKKKKK